MVTLSAAERLEQRFAAQISQSKRQTGVFNAIFHLENNRFWPECKFCPPGRQKRLRLALGGRLPRPSRTYRDLLWDSRENAQKTQNPENHYFLRLLRFLASSVR